ncbi:hypothetical protein CY34DRAFT_468273 [Suillus luteus UH-Slu-Lm8-n1]|uniref:DUF6534 domain-containing protein n=1 Tax=Suillus luteus UH-Slu-Lm8-n1 TaxID=930992 RepID=A0A0D0ASM1_9AGAM|nr:hypothetical protein EDD22DRAFT_1050029 [Suillus occidentalis]KIK37267.1 hypothetical protein CY34DRAFT_468273 [Suillus luteus UH-Slu-Lm8-n1]
MSGDVVTVATVYGAILLGTCIGCGLTGIVFVQTVLYFKFYPSDSVYNKVLVLVVWALDMMHTILIIISVWESVIVNFDKPELMDLIPKALGLSVAITAAVTFLVHCFFANRVRKLTKKWYFAAPLVFLAFLRLLSACVSTTEIMRLRHYSLFIKPFPSWVFTLGVTLSASVEFIITTVMVIFLGRSRTGFATMNHIINSLILYTLETGSFTCAVTIASLICWMVMRHNLIFLGMHFAIAKLYANSLLATLNTRKRLRADRTFSSQREADVYPASLNIHKSSQRILGPLSPTKNAHLNVNVETTVVSVIDDPCDDYDMADIESKGCDTACGTEKDSKEFFH